MDLLAFIFLIAAVLFAFAPPAEGTPEGASAAPPRPRIGWLVCLILAGVFFLASRWPG
jgi:hypothetical protein